MNLWGAVSESCNRFGFSWAGLIEPLRTSRAKTGGQVLGRIARRSPLLLRNPRAGGKSKAILANCRRSCAMLLRSPDLRRWPDLGSQRSVCGIPKASPSTGGYLNAGTVMSNVVSPASGLGCTSATDPATSFRRRHFHCEFRKTTISSCCTKARCE